MQCLSEEQVAYIIEALDFTRYANMKRWCTDHNPELVKRYKFTPVNLDEAAVDALCDQLYDALPPDAECKIRSTDPDSKED